jgi:hypothetical protein
MDWTVAPIVRKMYNTYKKECIKSGRVPCKYKEWLGELKRGV